MPTIDYTRRKFLKTGVLLASAPLIAASRLEAKPAERLKLLRHFKSPYGIACASDGRIIVADAGNYCIKVYTPDFKLNYQFGNPGFKNGGLNYPQGVAVYDDTIYVVDSNNGRIVSFKLDGTFIDDFGTIGGYPGAFYTPKGICVSDDTIWIVNTRNHHIAVFDRHNKKLIDVWGVLGDDSHTIPNGSREYHFRLPIDIAVSRENTIYISDSKHDVIKVVDRNGGFLKQFGGSGNSNGRLNRPQGIAFDSNGNLYVCDSMNKRIQRFAPDGLYIDQIAQGFEWPTGIYIDSKDQIYVADSGSHIIKIFNWS